MNDVDRILIIRLSSLGDIVQALEVPTALKKSFPKAKVHWLVRKDFADLPEAHPDIDQVWSYDRQSGISGLWTMIKKLRAENYSAIYDAHSNLRSHIICFFLKSKYFVRRSKQRLNRILLFNFGINKFPKPYRGTHSFLEPLKAWNVHVDVAPQHQLNLPQPEQDFTNAILMAPSAAWELKRWPIEHWKDLVQSLAPQKVYLLGGPQDDFCHEISAVDPSRVINLAGQLTWSQTTAAIGQAALVISGDTGVLHIADFLGRKTIALIGPTAFGYPSRPLSKVLEVDLDCRPCTKDGRGRCKNKVFKKCLVDIKSNHVKEVAQSLLQN